MREFGEFADIDVDKLLKGADEQLARMAELQEKLDSCVGRAQDENGMVTVACSQGGVSELHLHPKALRMSSVELADLIKEVLNEAARDLQRQVNEGVSAEFGEIEDSAAQVKEAEAAYNRTFGDVMGELDRIRRRLEL
ncbi:YbaB/EbfC family nucleoid-associated protein [Nonomuraea sp. NPDC050790]|uniref:YbaB/EbfC family nucleoid-associated protein n=1 Tax=Nonomuraea sp. NPDC050790 TaxID=3364371 RepID=UPI00378EEB1A